jgi:hypothetical protein
MQTKQSFYDIKNKIIKDRLSNLFNNNQKNIAKIIMFMLKRDKNKDKNV